VNAVHSHDDAGVHSLEESLACWAAQSLGGKLGTCTTVTGGNRRKGVIVTATRPDGTTVRGFLRYATDLPEISADPYTLWREAAVYGALQDRARAVPRLIGVHAEHEAMLIECVEGHADYHRLDPDRQRSIAAQLAKALADLHAAALLNSGDGLLDRPETRSDALAAELRIWRAMYAEARRDDALIAFALNWLEKNAPASSLPPVLVHGDAGAGNFLIDGDRLSAMIDWELAHFGDPMEDLAWVAFRAAIQPLPDYRAFLHSYEQASGTPINRDVLRYHRAFVAVRVLIVRHRDHGDFAAQSDPGNSLISQLLSRRALMTEIAAASDHALPPVDALVPGEDVSTRMHDFAIDSLKAVIAPALSDPVARARSKSLVRILKQLRQEAMLGDSTRAAGREDREAMLGADASETDLARAIDAQTLPLGSVIDLLWRRIEREHHVAAPALGMMAGRVFPEF
jgi:aminoglycoside phosphotransferase (APT) family kinase protein